MKKWALALLFIVLIGGDSVNTSEQQRWFDSFSGHATAQLQTAQHFQRQQQRSAAYYWQQQAASNGSLIALQQLKQQYPEQQLRWLQLGTLLADASSIAAYADYQLRDAQISWQQWQTKWYQPRYRQSLADYFDVINRFVEPGENCQSTIPVVANSAADKYRFMTLLADSLKLNSGLINNCFSFVVRSDLQCRVDQHKQRSDCTAVQLEGSQRKIILADYGKASSTKDTIILSRASDASVLLHELAHWWGFADEYAMVPELAKPFCQGRYQFSPVNLVITEDEVMSSEQLQRLAQRLPWSDRVEHWQTLAKRKGDDRWQLGSDERQKVGLFRAKTCDKVAGAVAWKPVSEVTAMEQHQSNNWPKLYRQLIKNYKANAN